jgi:tetratricopeptide (TPR) repeat protein
MPSTVNGIGTTYFLKRNRHFQEGECPHCHNHVKLESYETWYCICVLFIPVLPLGKKQILNLCPACSRHQVIKFHEWEKIRNEAISETSEELADAKDDPDAAIKMHGTLLAFQKGAEANRLADIMLNRFATVPQVQFYLGSCFERIGQGEKANACFLKAHELVPDDLTFRRAAALVLIEQKKPQAAQPLLDSFGPESPHFQPPLFFALARSYQDIGLHAEAMELYHMLLAKQPALAKEKEFAKAVRKSDKALGVTKPTLPADPWYRNKPVVWTLIAATFLGALGYWNYYISQHRTLSVVNGLKMPITVQIDGRPPIQISGRTHQNIVVSEGMHTAVVADPADRFPAAEFEMHASWWERFFRKPAFIVDPSQTSATVWEQIVYSDLKVPGDTDNKLELHAGEAFWSVPHADYHFEEFPAQVQAKAGSRILKSRVGMMQEEPNTIVNGALSLGKNIGDLDAYMEHHLIADPDDNDLLKSYVLFGMMFEKSESREKFLESHLSDKPVKVQWHRQYQNQFELQNHGVDAKAKRASLIAKYDGLLKQSPKEAVLLYLRGRLEFDVRTMTPLIDQALEIDSKQPNILAAKGYGFLVQGQTAEALQWYQKASAVSPNDAEIIEGLRQAQAAAKDFADLEKSLRTDKGLAPDHLNDNLALCLMLIATGRSPEAEQRYQTYMTEMQKKLLAVPQASSALLRSFELPYLYAKGDFVALAARAQEEKDFKFVAAMEQGQLVDLEQQATLPMDLPYWHLCRSIVARQLGNEAQAEASKTTAITMLEGQGGDEARAAELLRQGPNVNWDDLENLIEQPANKKVLLVVLAQEAKDHKSEYLDLAEKLNFDLSFPYHLIQKEIARLRK